MCVVAQPENVMYAVFYSKYKVPQGEMLCVFFFVLLLCVGCCLLRVFASFSSSKCRFFEIHFRERTLVLVSCCGLWFFWWCFAYVFEYLYRFFSGNCLVKILFFLGPVFEIDFRERTFGFVVLERAAVFRWCFAYSFAYSLGLSFPRRLGKNLLLLRFGFEAHFRERTLVFGVLLRSLVFFFRCVLPMFLLAYIVFFSGKCLVKILFFLGPVFEIHFRERTLVFAVVLRS